VSVFTGLARSPYKGLATFEDSELDALLFFGRERETEVIVANLLASKLTVLYGPSGVGKSSILRAAVVRRLREVAPAAEVALLNEWTVEPNLPSSEGETFLILDQFEEYFLYHEEGTLFEDLPALLEQPLVHVLIAVREDALARLDAFQSRIPTVFANRLRLDHLDAAAARAAIVGPLDRWNAVVEPDERMGIETQLVDAVIADVGTAPGATESRGSPRIEAPYLQLVMERIWEEERDDGSSMLRRSTLERLGGARAIVGAHLERALGALPPREAAIATSALRFLVTPSRTKIAHSFGDLVDYTDESPVELRIVLDRLASQRILRAVAVDDDEGGSRYEIFHDVLAEPVLAWRRGFEARAAVERERETSRRRHRRLVVLASGAALLAAAMVALTVYAFAQRGEAGRQRRAAETQAELALGQKKLAQQRAKEAKKQQLRADEQKQLAVHQKRAAKRAAAAAKRSAAQAKLAEDRANRSSAFAQHEKTVADLEAAHAQRAATAAKRSAQAAKRSALAAKRTARYAQVGAYVATAAARLATDPVQSVRAAVRAAALEKSARVEDALRASLVALRVRGILQAGGGAVNAATFSRDGSLVATASDRGGVRLFRTGSHELVRPFKVGSPVASVVFSADGLKLLAAARDGRALIWDTTSGTPLQTLPHGAAVLDAVFAGGGSLVVTGSADQSLRIWDATSGRLLHTVTGPRDVRTLVVSHDGTLVTAVSPGDPVARVYSLPSGDLVASLPQQSEVTAAAFSPSDDLLVTTGRRNAFVWSTQSWTLQRLLVGHEAALTDVVFAADGRAVTTSIDSSARVWNPETGDLIFTLAAQHQQKVLAAAVSPDGTQIATASADRTARIWFGGLGATPTVLAGHTGGVSGVSFSPDGKLVLTASDDGTARLWSPLVPALLPLGAQTGAVTTTSYSPDGRLVLSAGADGTARIWRVDGTLLQTLGHTARVNQATFVSGGREVLTASDDGTAKLWRVSDGSLLASFPHGAPVRTALLSADGIVTAGADGTVKLWTRAGTLVWSAAHGSPIAAAAVNATTVATGAADGTIRLWRERDGTPLRTLKGHTAAITSLAYSRDGTVLASGSGDNTARLWSSDGEPRHVLAGHTFGVTSVAFNPDGRLLVTGSIDGDARIWSVAKGRTVQRLSFHVSTVSQAAFSPDGRWVVTAGPTTAGIWQVRTGTLLYYLGGTTGQLLTAAFAPDSQRIVVGTGTGKIAGFDCTVCARTPALLAQAKSALRHLGFPRG
jgi:WD40 repeat protein